MHQSHQFIKTMKEAPKDEPSLNARLLEQSGYVQKLMAGVYSYLPLGNRVLRNIEAIVREEMNLISSEIFMPSLQPKENWIATDRWETMDVLFKLKSQTDTAYALGPTHEEVIAPLAKKLISSYRDLPLAFYQIQTKFRDELRSKSGLLRGREFRMKDLYSFHSSQEDLDAYYETVQKAYFRIYERLGVKAILTEASGGSFSKYSHEFQVELPTGEDVIYVCKKCGLAKNKEVYSGPEEECTHCGKTEWRETNASEVGNIFKLGIKYSVPFGVSFLGQNNELQSVIMGCYGIGTSRLMGVIAELSNDEAGLAWPDAVAPFKAHLIVLNMDAPEVAAQAADIRSELLAGGIEVLYDDREMSAGAKFADADLIGIPYRIVVSLKTIQNQEAEVKKRSENKIEFIKTKELLNYLSR